MRRIGLLLAAAAGLAFPLLLALAVYLASAGTLAEPVSNAAVPAGTIAQPSPNAPSSREAKLKKARGATPRSTTGREVSGPCDEAEHANDPRCTGTGAGDDRGRGRGRGGDDDGAEDNSGSGSGSDGSGGSDSSGNGSGSDSSGSGSGDSGGDD